MTPHPIPDAALDGHLAVLGTSGYGKTNTVKGAVERLLARGERVVIVDPTGVWWGLRLTRDGKSPSSYPLVIFGGRHADLPLDPAGGARVAAVLGTSTTPAILDTQQMSVADRTQFFTAFAEAILRENRGPMHLVLDEAHLFAPQSGGAGLIPDLLHATNNLVALGRSAGLSIVLITQRAAKLHKDALSQATSLVVMGLIDPRDQKAAKGWLDGAPDQSRSKKIMASLAGLPVGTGWVYAPRLGVLERAKFPLVETFDSGRPEANADAPALKPLDVAAIKAALQVVQEQPKAAGSAGAAGRKSASAAKAGAAPRQSEADMAAARRARDVEIAAAERRGFERGVRAAAERINGFELLFEPPGRPAATVEDMDRQPIGNLFAGRILQLLNGAAGGERASMPGLAHAPSPRQPAAVAEPAQSRPAPPPRAASAGLSPTARRILDVIEAVHPVSLPFKAAALRASASPRSSQFRQYEREILGSGAVEQLEGGRLRARRAGDPALAGADPVETFAAKLAPSWAAMLRTIASAREPLTKDAVAAGAGVSPTSSGLSAGLKELCAMDLIEKDGAAYRLAEAMR